MSGCLCVHVVPGDTWSNSVYGHLANLRVKKENKRCSSDVLDCSWRTSTATKVIATGSGHGRGQPAPRGKCKYS